MNSALALLLAITVAPLIVAICLLAISVRSRRVLTRALSGAFGLSLIAVGLFYTFTAGPYLWALHLESKWRAANPKTQTDLESLLSFYTKRDISVEESGWGGNHKLQVGERMTQYSLIGQPLDVVFRSDNSISAIYTSYEWRILRAKE